MVQVGELALWADTDHLAIDYRFPYALAGPESYIGYLSLFDRYADSELGEFHARQTPRFAADFGYDEEHGYEQMRDDLGLSVDPLHHSQNISGPTIWMFGLEHMNDGLKRLSSWLPPLDFPVVRTVCPLHDVGENASPEVADLVGVVVGDIARGKKTPQDKIVEAKIREVVFRMFYSDLPDVILERLEPIASHAEDSAAHQMYVWAHEVEALETAIEAGGHVIKILDASGPFDHRFSQLHRLADEVGTRTRLELQPAAQRFVYVKNILKLADNFFSNLNTAFEKGA